MAASKFIEVCGRFGRPYFFEADGSGAWWQSLRGVWIRVSII